MARRVFAAALVCLLTVATTALAATITVPANGNLQQALDQAQPGDTILLAAGATYVGNFVLPVKNGASYITIRSDAADSRLPAAGQRITPAFAAALPKLQSPQGAGGAPALSTAPGASYYIIQFVEFLPNANGSGAMLALGSAEASQNNLAVVPHDLIVDRCYLHAFPGVAQLRGIALNSGKTTIQNSHIGEIKSAGNDSQAIAGWNGPGPYTIVNNYLEAAGENFMLGGSTMFIPGVTPTGVEFRNNYVTKRIEWRGAEWTVKNLFELKHAQDVIVDGNVFENNWQAAQPGFAIVLTPRNQYGDNPWAVVQRVTFSNNLLRHVSSAWNVLGWDDEHSSQQTNHITFRNNVLEDVNAANWGGSGRMLLISETPYVTVDHNTSFNSGTALYAYNSASYNFVFTNNIVNTAVYGIFGDGAGEGNGAIAKYFPDGAFAGNVFVSCGQSWNYPSAASFAASFDAVGFVAQSSGNYRLAATSPYKNKGADGRDPGADIDGLNAALASSSAAPAPAPAPPTPAPKPSPTPAPPVPAPTSGPVEPGLPAPWARVEVGDTGIGGTASYSGGSFTVNGAGEDVRGYADSFVFVYQALTGDGQVYGRVASLSDTSPFAKAGVMIRTSLDPGASNVLLSLGPGGAIELLARQAQGGTTATITTSRPGRRWVRLVRAGSTITASASLDGRRWTTVGKATIDSGTTVYVGMAVCSHDVSRLAVAAFDNVNVISPSSSRLQSSGIAVPRARPH